MYKINEVKPSKELARKTKCDIKGLHEIVKKLYIDNSNTAVFTDYDKTQYKNFFNL